MDWQVIKKLAERWGGRCLIIEDGRPRYVLTTVEEYFGEMPPAADDELVDRVNQDMESLKTRERGVLPQPEVVEEFRQPATVVSLDDLPISES
ncbi:hypothetical protein HYW67_00405 [Candidatus Parcubacteria bacterium]|nr:hypothetical protein [Candidatus Parcubacteria bacterium]